LNTSPWPVRQDEAPPRLSAAGTSLPIEGPVLPIDSPIGIGRSLWGPFHRLCLQAQEGGRSHTIRSGPFTAEALPDGGLRLDTTLHVPTATGALRATLRLRRDASGAVVETGLDAPAEGDPAAAAALDSMRASLATAAGGFLERQDLTTGDMFTLGSTGGMPLLCRVLGQARHLGRAVVVARCAGTQPVAEADWSALLSAEGHVAVDVETGMVILSALACRLSGEAAPQAEIRLQAWVTLRQDRAEAA
jgi:hypothetical protein